MSEGLRRVFGAFSRRPVRPPAKVASRAPGGDGTTVDFAELLAWRARLVVEAPRRPARAENVRLAAAPGASPSRQSGRGLDFAEIRPWQPGDDARRIDWRHTARRGRPFTKVFLAERDLPLFIGVDLGHTQRFGTRGAFKSVQAARAAAVAAWTAVRRGDRVGGIASAEAGQRLTPARARDAGAVALLRCLCEVDGQAAAIGAGGRGNDGRFTAAAASLVTLGVGDSVTPAHAGVQATVMDSGARRNDHGAANDPSGPNGAPAVPAPAAFAGNADHFADAVARLARLAPPGARVLVIADFARFDPALQAALARLARRAALYLVQVFDVVEAEPPPPAVYELTDGDADLVVDLTAPEARAAWGEAFRQRSARLRAFAGRFGVPLLPLSTADDPRRALAVFDAAPARGTPESH